MPFAELALARARSQAAAARQAAAAAFRCAHGATRTDAGTFVCTDCYTYALG